MAPSSRRASSTRQGSSSLSLRNRSSLAWKRRAIDVPSAMARSRVLTSDHVNAASSALTSIPTHSTIRQLPLPAAFWRGWATTLQVRPPKCSRTS